MLFKSKAERKSARDLKIRTGLSKIKRQIKSLERNEQGYLDKARRARTTGDEANMGLIKGALKRTLTQRKLLERQLLTLETAIQLKDQAEAQTHFATSMRELSRAISAAFEQVDLTKTLGEFETALNQAESMEQRMDIFLDLTGESLSAESATNVVEDSEIDALIDAVSAPSSGGQQSRTLADEMNDLEREVGS